MKSLCTILMTVLLGFSSAFAQDDAPIQRIAFGSCASQDYPQVVVGSSRVDLQACKLEYSIVSPK